MFFSSKAAITRTSALVFLASILLLPTLPLAADPVAVGNADEAIYDPVYFPAGYVHEFALYMCTEDHDCSPSVLTPEPGVDFDFTPEGSWVENDDGTARLIATAVDRSDPNKTFDVDVTFFGRTTTTPAGSPKKELVNAAYVDGGGPINPDTWRYYTSASGTLTGGGLYDGAVIQLTRTGPAWQVGYGANNKNTNPGASGWFQCDIVSQPTTGEVIATVTGCDINIDLELAYCPETPEAGEFMLADGSQAISLPGIADDFVFDFSGGTFEELAGGNNRSFTTAGTAELIGSLRSQSQPSLSFDAVLTWSSHSLLAPPGSPQLELDPAAYTTGGGTVDPDTWRYYGALTGTLTGTSALAGAVLELAPVDAAQIGDGANGRNVGFGLSQNISWVVTTQPDNHAALPEGDGSVTLDLLGACPQNRQFNYCVDEALRDEYNSNGNHAIAMPGIAKDLVFAEPASFQVFADGTAQLTGLVHEINDPNKIFAVTVDLSGYTTSAPAGSPKKQLPSSAYAPNGPADPSTWWYYPTWSATLVGQVAYAGAVVTVTRKGPAWQVGIGANNKNAHFGASAWFYYNTQSQPSGSIQFPNSGSGDFNIDLVCPPADDTPDDGGGDDMPTGQCHAADVVDYSPGTTAGGGTIAAARRDPTHALDAPEGGDWINFVSLGFGGHLVLDFTSEIVNGPGNDLMVVETSFGNPSCASYPESVRVLASQDGVSWTDLGSACLDAEFDLGPLAAARYLRLEDDSNPNDFNASADAYDVDGVVAYVCQPVTPAAEPIRGIELRFQRGGQAIRVSEVQWLNDEGIPVRLDRDAVHSNISDAHHVVDRRANTWWQTRPAAASRLLFDTTDALLDDLSGLRLQFPLQDVADGRRVGPRGNQQLSFSVFVLRGDGQWEEIHSAQLRTSTLPRGWMTVSFED